MMTHRGGHHGHGQAGSAGHGAVIPWARRYEALLAVALAGRGRRLRAGLADLLELQPAALSSTSGAVPAPPPRRLDPA
jgi:hypothetical protein